MSAALLGLAFRAEMASHVAKLVLLKLVDAAEEDGTRIFPAVRTIARAAQAHERTVQKTLRTFQGVGLLRVGREGGSGPGKTTEYALDLEILRRIRDEGWEAVAVDRSAEADAAQSEGGDDKGGVRPPLSKGGIEDDKGGIGNKKGWPQGHPTPPDSSIDPSVEREGAREEKSSPASRSGVSPSSPLAEAKPDLLDELKRQHPNIAADRPTAIDAAWGALSAAERRAAHGRHGDWMAECKAAGRSKVVALSTYLREKPWTLLAASTRAGAGDELWRASGMVPAWSRLWWCLLFRVLEANRSTVGDPRSPAAALYRRQVTLAERRIGWRLEPEQIAGFEVESAGFVGVPRDGTEAAAWSAWLRKRAGVALPLPDSAHWIYVPASLPPQEPGTGVDNLSADELEGLG